MASTRVCLTLDEHLELDEVNIRYSASQQQPDKNNINSWWNNKWIAEKRTDQLEWIGNSSSLKPPCVSLRGTFDCWDDCFDRIIPWNLSEGEFIIAYHIQRWTDQQCQFCILVERRMCPIWVWRKVWCMGKSANIFLFKWNGKTSPRSERFYLTVRLSMHSITVSSSEFESHYFSLDDVFYSPDFSFDLFFF